ncbi:heterokaryon incompatibility protein-domain-containing protein [Xylaria cf. heliscus]|nr:heterokaryon incompatibility protein-domain-containing protein [Xylaria cf. heliscus]
MDTDEPVLEPRLLCGKCRTIPFKEIQRNPKINLKSFNLGTYEELKKRPSCPFCCLVFESICDLAREWALSRHIEYAGPDKFVEESWPYSIEVDWRRYYFDTSITNIELRLTTGACPRLGCVVSPNPVEVDAIISLLQHCDAAHDCLLSISHEASCKFKTLRAIDVGRMCVASISPSTHYVALSYVWGGVTLAHLVQANKEELMSPYGLEAYREGLPVTIRDAIKLVRKMNIRYLWVDALCLIQDDREDMEIGIRAMSAIYEHAYLTIVAADGLNANAGLPGVSSREANQIVAEILPEVQLVGVRKADLMLDEMHYSHRAWTFQEFHMSRRKLIFLDNIMYYQCMESFWGEDREEQPIYPEFKSLLLERVKKDQKIREYTNLLARYSTRQASYDYDVVNAMVSVYYKIFGESYSGHLFCIPVAAFDWFMCFYAFEGERHYTLQRRKRLPSWAWSGWRGRLLWNKPFGDAEIAAWTAKSTWIVWYTRGFTRTSRTVIWIGTESDAKKSRVSAEKILTERVANMQKFSSDPLPFLPSREIPSAFEHQNNLLQFWTFSASFDLRVDKIGQRYLQDLDFGTGNPPLEIFDGDKYKGFIYMDERCSKYDQDAVQIIAISEADTVIKPDYAFIYTPKHTSLSSEDRANGCWYNVLYIVEESGVAERKGFGQVHTEKIRISPDSPWSWKEIILG